MTDDDENSDDAPPTVRRPPARVRVRTPIVDDQTSPLPEPSGDGRASDYEVGYGKPPRAHRFQPGQSGNPKGRPKGSLSTLSILSDELAKPISANIGGRAVTMTRRRALVRRFIEKGLAGDLRAIALLIKWDATTGSSDGAIAGRASDLSPAEDALLNEFFAKHSAEGEP